MNQPAAIEHILAHMRTVAVVGLSPKAHRASYQVAQYMQRNGWRVVAVNPAAGVEQILGEKVYASLTQAAAAQKIDLVDVFRASEDVPPVVDEAIAIGAAGLWLQLGIVNDAACDKARAAAMHVVQDACLLVEHRRWAHALGTARDGAARDGSSAVLKWDNHGHD